MTSIRVPNGDIILKRLDNCTWSTERQPAMVQNPKHRLPEVDELRIQTPNLSTPGQAYELAQLVARTLQSVEMFALIQKKDSLLLDIERHNGSLNGRWLLTIESVKSLTEKLFQWIPFVRIYPSHRYLLIQASRPEAQFLPAFVRRVKDLVLSRFSVKISGEMDRAPIQCQLNDKKPFYERLKCPAFSDPFTQVATQALQTIETEFVSEKAIQGSTRLVLDKDGQLKIDLISLFDDPQENQRTVRKFRDFVLEEYGPEHVEYAQFAYGFQFDQMIERALPLLPDHVFKMNVGVNNIEMSHLESLYKRLHLLRVDLALHSAKKSLEELLQYYHGPDAPVHFCVREIRGVLSIGGKDIVDGASLKAFLDRLIGDVIPDHLPHLMPEQFNALVAMIWPEREALPRLLTGRQISHLAICGYKTMGDPNESDPARDQAELLQICSDLQKGEDWDNFYELIAHVAVKKSLFREYRGINQASVWRTGVLIPAPHTKDQTARWYCVNKVSDNGEGNLSYILLPATKGYRLDGRPLPMIQLYRSTNSDHNAIDSMGSIENDLNPQGAPGSLGETVAQNSKGGFFYNRTIPLWVAYLIYGNNQMPEKAIESYREALRELEKVFNETQSLDEEKRSKIRELKSSYNIAEMRAFLLNIAESEHELPKFKRGQDLVFVGHSLGGALAQYGIHYFGPSVRRIPCPGYNYICRSYNGPATNSDVDEDFMDFGRKHRDVINGLSQHWKIFHQFEYGDFVPEAGESHLGTHRYNADQDRDWLDIYIQIFRPLEGARALTITTCPTHGRRISLAQKDVDFRLNVLDPKHLSEYDHAWMLSGSLKKTFGYRILVSPRVTEIMRRSIGVVGVPLIQLKTVIYNFFYPEEVKRDRDGVFSCEYRAAQLQPQYWTDLRKVVR